MISTRAVVVDPEALGRLAIREVEEPKPGPTEALIRVAATSLNRGEVRIAMGAPAGRRPGWDLAGTVQQPAADGSGPAAGARVVGHRSGGAWAELVAVHPDSLAELPAEVTFSQAATLPVAGMTPLRMLDKRGGLLERRVLITGASGGVGPFAIQLARLMGAQVVAQVRREDRAGIARQAGAHEVVVSEDGSALEASGPYDLILDGVGGSVLSHALAAVASMGAVVTYGTTGSAETQLDLGRFFRTGNARFQAFMMNRDPDGEPASVALGRLARLVADGRLHPMIEVEAPWTEIGQVAQRLVDRDFAGKAVIHIGG